MTEHLPAPVERNHTYFAWPLLVGLVLLAACLLWPVISADDERTYTLDHETASLHHALFQYKVEFGAFPQGDSRAICRALSGDNPKSLRFIEMPRVSPSGDFLDRWGTPYRIYYSGDFVLIRSAGANQQFDSSKQRKQTDDYFGG